MSELTTLTQPLLQYGILGVIFAYVIVSDWLARQERRKAEALRAQQDSDREKDCVKRIRELEDRQMKFMQNVATTTNSVLSDLTRELRRHGFKINTPTDLHDISNDETRTIKRRESNQ